MRTIKTYFKGAPFYNAFIRTCDQATISRFSLQLPRVC